MPAIDVEELAAARERGATVLDVRQLDEYLDARVPGVLHVPLAEVPEHLDELPTDQPLYVICRTGARSAKAASFLRGQGIDAINVAGGTLAWIDAGHRTDAGPAQG